MLIPNDEPFKIKINNSGEFGQLLFKDIGQLVLVRIAKGVAVPVYFH
jgi:hypothetical protein